MSQSQHIVLDALENAVYDAISAGTVDASVLDNVPEPHVFYPTPDDSWDEDDVAAIRAVGSADVLARIRYYTEVLDRQERATR